jgi:O-antigen/teichoic acid export membrane protein
MSSARVYARNLAANWLGHGAAAAVMFFLSPFVVHTLGGVRGAEYGIWSLLTVLTGYMGLFDLGLRASTGRHIALYVGKGDGHAVDETIRTALGFFSLVGLGAVAAGAGLGWAFPKMFASVPADYRPLVRWLLPLLAVNVWMAAYSAVFSNVLAAHDRFDLTRAVDVAVLAVRTGGTVAALKLGYGLVGLAVMAVAGNALGLAGNWALARRVHPGLRIWPLTLRRGRFGELIRYGIPAFLSAVAILLTGRTDLLITGWAMSMAAVTIYDVGAKVMYYSAPFVALIGTTFFPPVQRAVARGEMGPARWLFFRQVRLAMLFGVPAFVGAMVFARPFLRLWMLDETFDLAAVDAAAGVMVILAASKLMFLFTVGSNGLLASLGHIRFTAAAAVVEALANVGLSLLFVLKLGWGLWGVAAGTLVSRAAVRSFLVPWFACRKAGVPWGRFCVRIVAAGLAAAALLAAAAGVLRALWPVVSWGVFFGQVALTLAAYVPVGLWVLLPAADRSRLWRRLRPRGAAAGGGG